MGTKRTGLFRAGLAIVTTGAILGVAGLTASPAGADKPDTFKITLCHRTNAPSNPYRIIEVSVDASDGVFVGPDHSGHEGPAFDFTADPQDADYPYTTPRSGDQWGDIIPPYEFDGGSYPGMNWEDGAAIHEAGCQGPEEPADPECPEGQVWDDANDDGVLDEGECSVPFECPEGTEWDDANDDLIVQEDECVEPLVFECPEGTEGSDDNDNGIVDEGECEAPEILTEEPTTPDDPEDVVQVLPATVTKTAPATLPHTGTGTARTAEIGLGLVLLGIGAMVLGKRDELATA